MADINQYNSDKMFYDETVYQPDVRLDEDGFYRWRYTLDNYHDRKMYGFQLKFWAIFAIAGAVLGALLARVPADQIRQAPSQYQTMLTQRRLLYAVIGYAVFLIGGLLITGLVRLIERGPATYWYRMNNEFIQVQPSSRTSGINRFDEVKRVEVYPDINEIRLIFRFGKSPVLVRKEDLELVKGRILANIPQSVEIITR